jgi:biotin carboxyl carrier protein
VKYTVDVLGESIQVDVRDGPKGLEVSVSGDAADWAPASWVPAPAPLHVLELGDERRELVLAPDALNPGGVVVTLGGHRPLRVAAVDELTRATSKTRGPSAGGSGPRLQRSAMPGVVVELRVEAGQAVTKGQVLLILEAMKMQNEICAQGDAVIKQVHVATGEAVAAGAKLVEFGG